MKLAVFAGIAAFALAGPALAANADLMKPVKGFVDAANVGKPLGDYFTASQSMTDEFAPHHWSGPGGAKAWQDALAALLKTAHITGLVWKVGEPTHVERSPAHAYLVAPSTVDWTEKGKAKHEDGTVTFAMDATKTGWKIAAFTWSNPKPAP
jgi:hypothetical protein